jgi:signal transduction histidine kinase/ligand-binding sensor domain-containing protein
MGDWFPPSEAARCFAYCAFQIRQALLCLLLPLLVHAEKLPIRIYRTGDGLALDSVSAIATDKYGYVWIGTWEGISRFDGNEFFNYGQAEGLPADGVSSFLTTRDGVQWIGTIKGLCRYNPESHSAGERFTVYQPSEVRESQKIMGLAEDRDGSILCGTWTGLFRLRRSPFEAKFEKVDVGESNGDALEHLLVDRAGVLWFATDHGLYRRAPGAGLERFGKRNGLPSDSIGGLVEDRAGRLWVGTDHGLCVLTAHPDPRGPAVAAVYLPRTARVYALLEGSDGTIWAGTTEGLWKSFPGSPPGQVQGFQGYGLSNGLSNDVLTALGEDRDGNLWLGSETGGAMKIARGGMRTYDEADGLRSTSFGALLQDRTGHLMAITGASGKSFLQRFDGAAFTAIPLHPGGSELGWGASQLGFEDHTGDWWLATAHGLYRFPHIDLMKDLQHTRPKAMYSTRNGLPGDLIFRVFEDSRDDIWISSFGNPGNGLSRWQRSTGLVHCFSRDPGFGDQAPSVFGEDRNGAVWIGFFSSRIAKFWNNHFVYFAPADNRKMGSIYDIFTDHNGRLWIATGHGLVRIDDPSPDQPSFKFYTTEQGFSSNSPFCLGEDLFGRLYAASRRGLDRLNPDGLVEHFTTADGLALGLPVAMLRDRQGALWFGNKQGLSRWLPDPPQRNSPPPILIRGVRVRGIPQPISELGSSVIPPFSLSNSQNQLQFDFVSITFRPAERRRYQYKLENVDTDWRPTASNSVNYASLPPGSYRFLVRAVDSAGAVSAPPAIAVFTILPPYWESIWFRLLALLALSATLYAAYRARLRGMTERVKLRYEERLDERARIARELHDTLLQSLAGVSLQLDGVAKKIGSSSEEAASQIRVVRQQVDASFREARQKVQDLRSPMLQGRAMPEVLREALEQMVADYSIRLQVIVNGQPRPLGEELDETVLRIGQEAVANAVRHSQASQIEVSLTFGDDSLDLRIRDNGRGFEVGEAQGRMGHWGLRNMRERAQRIGGQFTIKTAPGHGTEIEAIVPTRSGLVGSLWKNRASESS